MPEQPGQQPQRRRHDDDQEDRSLGQREQLRAAPGRGRRQAREDGEQQDRRDVLHRRPRSDTRAWLVSSSPRSSSTLLITVLEEFEITAPKAKLSTGPRLARPPSAAAIAIVRPTWSRPPPIATRPAASRSRSESCTPTANNRKITPISATAAIAPLGPTRPGVKEPSAIPATRKPTITDCRSQRARTPPTSAAASAIRSTTNRLTGAKSLSSPGMLVTNRSGRRARARA